LTFLITNDVNEGLAAVKQFQSLKTWKGCKHKKNSLRAHVWAWGSRFDLQFC